MRVYDLREYLFDLVRQYFQNARVIWLNEVQAKKKLPMVTLAFRNISAASFPATEIVGEEIVEYYPSTALLEVNTFLSANGDGRNDAAADLQEFMHYLGSPQITDELFLNDISIIQNGSIQDIPQFLGMEREYHAMVEMTVGFCQLVTGQYGISRPEDEKRYDTDTGIWAVRLKEPEADWRPTTSGGGNYELESLGNYDIAETEVTMKEEE